MTMYKRVSERDLFFFFIHKLDFCCMLQVSARWDPVGACRPIIEEAPVFYPTLEVLVTIRAIFIFVVY